MSVERRHPEWRPCSYPGCIGIPALGQGECLVHLLTGNGDPKRSEEALVQLKQGAPVDLRGARVSREVFSRILAAVPRNRDGAPVLLEARFDQARFDEKAHFEGVWFRGMASFNGAQFSAGARFDRARFDRPCLFGGARFEGPAFFERTRFDDYVEFIYAHFDSQSSFEEARFGGLANFTFNRFIGPATLVRTTFGGGVMFSGVQFHDDALFWGARFGGATTIEQVRFDKGASLAGAQFRDDTRLGPVLASTLHFTGASFHAAAIIEVAAVEFSCAATRFDQGATVRIRFADILLDGSVFARPSSVSFAEEPFRLPGSTATGPEGRFDDADLQERPAMPRLLSVRHADVSNLVLADLDLRWCLFRGAHRLDQLRIEGPKQFAKPPRGWRWSRRYTIAEERLWRASRRPGQRGWWPPDTDALVAVGSAPGHQANPTDPEHIASLYRALRKAEEDAKHEPGAADFYYGEMEMRRHAKREQLKSELQCGHRGVATAASIEYMVLSSYWLVAGYGLRAWRALVTLLVVVFLGAGLFAFWGFAAEGPTFSAVGVDASGSLIYAQQHMDRPAGVEELPAAIRFSAQSATALLLRSPDRLLTPVGEWTQMALRVIGPALVGLAVLAIRAKVKR